LFFSAAQGSGPLCFFFFVIITTLFRSQVQEISFKEDCIGDGSSANRAHACHHWLG
jgi:hypothetical protein